MPCESKAGAAGWIDDVRSARGGIGSGAVGLAMHNEAREKLAGVKAEAASLREALGAVSPGTPGTRLERLRAFDVQYERERAYMEQILHPVKAAAAAAEDARRLLTSRVTTESGGPHRFDGAGRAFVAGSVPPPRDSRDSRDRVATGARGVGIQAEMMGAETAPAISRVPAVPSSIPRVYGLEPSVADSMGASADTEGARSRGAANVGSLANTLDSASRSDAPGFVHGVDALCQRPAHGTPPTSSRGEGCTGPCGRATPAGYLTPRIGEKDLSRREGQALDEKIGGQLRRVEDQIEMQSRQSEKLQEVLYKKAADAEVTQSRLERRVFELVGTVNGLSDETQRQVRRVEAMDARIAEFRHDLEEQFRQHFGELQTEVRSISSRCSARMSTAEQQQLRQQRQFEELESERHERGAELTGAVLELRERMEAMADAQESDAMAVARVHQEISPAASGGAGAEGLEEKCWHIEKQFTEIGWKLDQALSDLHDKTSRLADHEERLKGMRTKLDSQDHYATFDERIRHDWEARIDRMQRSVQEAIDGHGEQKVQIDLMRQQTNEIFERHERHEGAINGLYDQYGSLALDIATSGSDAPASALGTVLEEDDMACASDAYRPGALGGAQECGDTSRLPDSTAQMAQLHREVASTAARIAELEGDLSWRNSASQAELAGAVDRLYHLEAGLASTSVRLGELEDRVPQADVFDAKMAALTEHAQALSTVQREVGQQLEALNGGRS